MRSLASRAAVAVALMAGFYLLAFLIAGILLAIPAIMLASGHLFLKIAIFCIVGGLAILWSIVPRIDRFPAPGPKLEPESDPALFAEIERVAAATGQAMPVEVYLINDVNAWVAQRGGIMGFFSRRVMGIGLPLLQSVSVSELRAILAHEFGHYHGGDTRLGPFIYKTRAAIGRTLENLGQHSSGLQAPFEWYGKLFLRITQAISRSQELGADRLSVAVAGTDAAVKSLVTVHRVGAAHDDFWYGEVVPVLQAGFRPQLVDGFARFVSAPNVANQLDAIVKSQKEEAAADPYDSHPPLSERLAALEALPRNEVASDDRPAIVLLARAEELELAILRAIATANGVTLPDKAIAWSDTTDEIYLPMWKGRVTEHGQALSLLRPADLPSLDVVRFGANVSEHDGEEMQAAYGSHVIGCALLSALVERGWSCDASPGLPVAVTKEGKTFEPFSIMDRLREKTTTEEEWEAFCHDAGIAGIALGRAGQG